MSALLSTAFFELIDRGMGIVSLHSKQYPGFRLRMNNFILEGKVCTCSPEYNYLLTFHLSDYLSIQGDPTLLADWRLKENADGTVQFESVTSPGACVGINRSGTLVKDLSIFLVVRHVAYATPTSHHEPLTSLDLCSSSLQNIQKFGGAETITK